MFWTVPLSIIRSFSPYTQLQFRPDPARKLLQQTCMTYTIAVYTVKTPDDGQRNCPKHVEFYSKNKFEELVHLVGFIIKIARICYVISQNNFGPINRLVQKGL